MRLARKKKPRDEGLEEGEEVPDDEPEERLKMPKRRDLYTICREAGTFGIYYSQTGCSFALNIATLQSIVQCLLSNDVPTKFDRNLGYIVMLRARMFRSLIPVLIS